MSHIAAALAKSKGKAVQPVAEDVPTTPTSTGVSRPPMSMPANAAPVDGDAKKKKMIMGAAVGVVVLSVGAWFLLSQKEPQSAPVAKSASPGATKNAQPAKQVDFAKNEPAPTKAGAASAPNVSAPAKAAPTPAAPVVAETPTPVPSDEIFNTVRKFALSAVKSGPNGRAVINGKAYQAGDEVAPGITLREIRDGQLIFVDENGSVYPRKF